MQASKQKTDRLKSSQFKGVSWYWRHRKWQATIGKDGRQSHLGYYASEVEAARAYNRAAVEAFGAFARLNQGV